MARGRALANPTVARKTDRGLSSAQTAIGEIISFGGSREDRELAIYVWDEIEKLRRRLRGG